MTMERLRNIFRLLNYTLFSEYITAAMELVPWFNTCVNRVRMMALSGAEPEN